MTLNIWWPLNQLGQMSVNIGNGKYMFIEK